MSQAPVLPYLIVSISFQDLTLDLHVVALHDSTFREMMTVACETVIAISNDTIHIENEANTSKLFWKKVTSINSAGLLMVEPFKKKVLLTDREKGYWEETFKDHKDTKPHGSSSIGIDVAFIGMKHAFGLPEHADAYGLRDTKNYEPYRLYNLDVFEYDLNSQMALYGSVPYMVRIFQN
ncbi:hypothetical protein ANCCEY_10083 [Ancylostoma ceylanicum]|uniref:Glycoside hydrolase family 31 N-terminal domain-containing protein n=1 Tax=Ancylostoma ceylanicum TaxID=53326 RepID=A0A0D6LFU1_9BILA|nr:hypothetical protein ANCCEY_10083 [Ancylostoma ceylanicum]